MIEVIGGESRIRFFCSDLCWSAEELRSMADVLDKRTAELAANRIEEVYRSEYVTAYRRGDGMESCVACDGIEVLPWHQIGPNGYEEFLTRAEAESAAKKALLEYKTDGK